MHAVMYGYQHAKQVIKGIHVAHTYTKAICALL
jgi:hypothetical protein